MDTTAVETTASECLLVQIDDTARTVTFLNEDNTAIRTYSYDTFAGARGALAIDAGRDIVIDGGTVANLQQFADLDAFGLRRRAA